MAHDAAPASPSPAARTPRRRSSSEGLYIPGGPTHCYGDDPFEPVSTPRGASRPVQRPAIRPQIHIPHPLQVHLRLHLDSRLPEVCVAAGYGALHHDQRSRERQASKRVDQHISQGGHRLDPGGWQQEPGMMDCIPTDRLLPAVVDVAFSVRGQRPQAICSRSAGTRQQLPVLEHGNQIRRRRRKRIQTPVRLQDPRPYRPPEGGVIHSQPGKGGSPCGSAADFQGSEGIHLAMVPRF
ncbi:hypothetical protein J2T23_001077 [Pseudarthrobacter niigatensis]|uniref:Uncharacterized protein n=1 Tax=Pseudarthrobacter niigatensis TaxID=369935 RepID=A0AAJ1SWT1_9MICC|nr:hypothetical protein [Pseudarthrobacter niigatensis]MDQ0266039.1 hypothetical protein [Pseudarthrobacter niigatensis]